MNRFQAQSHLLSPGNEAGAFLVRRSEKDNVGYVLSGKTRRRQGGVKQMERRSGCQNRAGPVSLQPKGRKLQRKREQQSVRGCRGREAPGVLIKETVDRFQTCFRS